MASSFMSYKILVRKRLSYIIFFVDNYKGMKYWGAF